MAKAARRRRSRTKTGSFPKAKGLGVTRGVHFGGGVYLTHAKQQPMAGVKGTKKATTIRGLIKR